MGNSCCHKRHLKKNIVLLLVGLDNAGKTKAANRLAGNRLNSPVPTVGFSVFNLKYSSYSVKVFDLGGGPNIRGIWNKYFVDAHGVIFVIDSSDYSRLDEVKTVLEDLLYSEKIAGKPLLVLANKQDHQNALDEIDIIEYLNIEQMVNTRKCPTLVQSCSASENSNKLDAGIQKGYEWLMSNIAKNYDTLNKRVETDVKEQQQKEREDMIEKIRRIKNMQKIEDQSKMDDDVIESYSDYARKLNGHVDNDEVITTNSVLDITDHNSDSGEDTSITFPPMHHNGFHNCALHERPTSAVQMVRHQLQLNSSAKKTSFKLRSNKTAPVNLYGIKLSHSAKEKRANYAKERRNLKSADDYLFTISNKLPNYKDLMESSGDNFQKDIVQLSALKRCDRSPPVTTENNRVPWSHKALNGDNAISVVDID